MVKNLPANAGDTGSSPGPGRPHTQSKRSVIFIYLSLFLFFKNFFNTMHFLFFFFFFFKMYFMLFIFVCVGSSLPHVRFL